MMTGDGQTASAADIVPKAFNECVCFKFWICSSLILHVKSHFCGWPEEQSSLLRFDPCNRIPAAISSDTDPFVEPMKEVADSAP